MSDKQYPDLMTDIETFDVVEGGIVLSVASVPFNIQTGEIGKGIQVNFDLYDSVMNGFTVNPSTAKFWKGQPAEAKKDMMCSAVSVEEGVKILHGFYNTNKQAYHWANDANFDLDMLQCYFKSVGKEIPTPFYNYQNVRTLVALGERIHGKNVKRIYQKENPVSHKCMQDAIDQIKYCCEGYKLLAQGLTA